MNFDLNKISLGTTLVAAEFNGGVIIGADSRTSSGTYVANRVSDKLTQITDNIYCCRSGASADTQQIADIVKYQLNMHRYTTRLIPTVLHAATAFKNIGYEHRDKLCAGIIVAGYDEKRGGQVYSIPLGGALVPQPIAISGSGSTFLYGFLDTLYKENMNEEECFKLVVKAVSLAISRDGSSGGVIRVAVIDKNGVRRNTVYENEFCNY